MRATNYANNHKKKLKDFKKVYDDLFQVEPIRFSSSHFFCKTEDLYLDTRFRGCSSNTGFISITMIVTGNPRTNSSLITANRGPRLNLFLSLC